MKLSLSNGIYYSMPIEENIPAIKKLGFDNIEFNMKSIQEDDDDAVYKVKELLRTHQVRCLTLHSATLPVQDESEIQRAIIYGLVSVDFAHTFGASVLVIHSNASRKLPAKKRQQLMKKIFPEIVAHAKDLKVKLALENLSFSSNGYGKDVLELEEIFSILGDETAGVTLDFCHSQVTGTTMELLEKYHSRLRNIHISNPKHAPFTHKTPALQEFLSKLQSYGYAGPLTMELNSNCTDQEILQTRKVIEETLQNGRQPL
ncbi:MAG: sugar phosphate isomerase/epimerase [Candidatus Bathyarchaeota archaeon]|nr:sugar phosphate isomerase/epimerase [Candidatus Bathyarchaeota archaeon]